MTVIAITREFGTRGLEVAHALGARLGLEVLNDELIERDIAQLAGLSNATVHRYFDGSASLLERWRTDESHLSRTTTEEVLQLATKDSVVVRGWGAPYLLRDVPHVVCVRICAPMPFREKVLVERGVAATPGAARSMIEVQDAANDKVMRRLFGADGRDALVYSLVLNTGRLNVEQCVEQISHVAAAEQFQTTVQSRQVLLDRLIQHRAHRLIDQRVGADRGFTHIMVDVVDGHVTLSGESLTPDVNVAAADIVRKIEGVSNVRSEITVLPYYRRHAA